MKTVGQKQTASAEIREREQQEEKFRPRDENERANMDEAQTASHVTVPACHQWLTVVTACRDVSRIDGQKQKR